LRRGGRGLMISKRKYQMKHHLDIKRSKELRKQTLFL